MNEILRFTLQPAPQPQKNEADADDDQGDDPDFGGGDRPGSAVAEFAFQISVVVEIVVGQIEPVAGGRLIVPAGLVVGAAAGTGQGRWRDIFSAYRADLRRRFGNMG